MLTQKANTVGFSVGAEQADGEGIVRSDNTRDDGREFSSIKSDRPRTCKSDTSSVIENVRPGRMENRKLQANEGPHILQQTSLCIGARITREATHFPFPPVGPLQVF